MPANLTPEHATRIMHGWQGGCRVEGKDPAAELDKHLTEDRAEREAWKVKCAAYR